MPEKARLDRSGAIKYAVELAADDASLTVKLALALLPTRADFDHIKVAHLGSRLAVFVVKGNQSTVLYDKTEGFPSAKLLASLVLLGSP